MKAYEIASEEGANYASEGEYVAEIGDKVKLDLSKDTETALLAAGWLSEPDKKKEG